MFGSWLGGVVDGRSPYGQDVGLAGGIESREQVLPGGRSGGPPLVALVVAGVSCRRQDSLALGCGLLEQQVLSLLHAGLGHLGQLLADAPARGDNLVDVLVHDLRVLVQAAGGGVRGLVDVDVRLRGDRGDILDVEVRLVVRAAGPGLNLAAVNRDDRQPAAGKNAFRTGHLCCLGGAEIARVEVLHVGRQERLQLVHGDVLALSEVSCPVKPESTVGVGDLVVGEPAGSLRVLLGGRACVRRAGRVREAH